MTARLSRDEKQAQTRELLLAAAAKMFARRGYDRVSLRDLADEAGLSKGAVYSNFESKDDLFLALFEARCRETLAVTQRALVGDGPIGARIHEIGDQIARQITDDREWTLLAIEFWSRAMRDSDLQRRFSAMWEETRMALAHEIDEQVRLLGVAPALRSDQLASATMALTNGLALQMLVDPGRIRPETVGASLALLVCAHQPLLSMAALSGPDREAEAVLVS